MNFSGNNVWISHIEVVGIYERVQLNVNPNKNLDLVVLNVLFDIGLGLIKLEGTVCPPQRYVLYSAPFQF